MFFRLHFDLEFVKSLLISTKDLDTFIDEIVMKEARGLTGKFGLYNLIG